MRILSKSQKRKSKKGVSWTQSERNRKLIAQAKQFKQDLVEVEKISNSWVKKHG